MAHLLIVELPGGNDTDIIEAAIQRGDRFTFLTSDLSHYQNQPFVRDGVGQARQQIEIKDFSYEQVEQAVLEINAEYPFDAILCLIDTRIVDCARLAKKLGLRFLNPDSAKMLRDKFSVRQKLQESGIEQGEFALATSNRELRAAVEKIGLPVLIKPSDGYGSQNIVVLRNPEDLDPLLTPVDDLLPIRADYGFGVRSNDRLLVERYMEGTVVGCDTFTENRWHRMLGINEKLLCEPPSFTIRGGCFLPNRREFDEIEGYVFALLDAVDFDWGATHIELMLTKEGPRLIEINPRLVGAKIGRLVSASLGISIHQALIALHCGETSLLSRPVSNMPAVSRWILGTEAGILDCVNLPSLNDKRIRHVEIMKASGDYIKPAFENVDRIGYVMVCATTRLEAEQLADRFIAGCEVKIRKTDSRT